MPESKISMSSLYGPDLLLLYVYKIKAEHKLYKQFGMFFRQTGIAWHSLEQQVLQVYCVRYTKRLALEQDQVLPDAELLWARFQATSSSGAQNFKVDTTVHRQELTEHTSPSDSSFVYLGRRQAWNSQMSKVADWPHMVFQNGDIHFSHQLFFLSR